MIAEEERYHKPPPFRGQLMTYRWMVLLKITNAMDKLERYLAKPMNWR
jgi:hypothetical protein